MTFFVKFLNKKLGIKEYMHVFVHGIYNHALFLILNCFVDYVHLRYCGRMGIPVSKNYYNFLSQRSSIFHLHTCRIWLLLKHPTNDTSNSFNWSRDSIYIAIILLGFGGATLMIISLSMIALLVGKYSVSLLKG